MSWLPCSRRSEICSLHKPGGLALDAGRVVQAAALATARAERLHAQLQEALAGLEARSAEERTARLALLREMRRLQPVVTQPTATESVSSKTAVPAGGIDRNDPMLSWQLLHQTSAPLL